MIWSKPDGIIAFVHDKIREAVVSTIPPQRRRELHKLVAEYLLINQTARSFDLAYHFDEAGLPDRAWPHALKAAQQARQRYALDSAEAQFRIAARALTVSSRSGSSSEKVAGHGSNENSPQRLMDPASRYDIESGLAKVLLLLGKYEEADTWLNAALASAPSPVEEAQDSLPTG